MKIIQPAPAPLLCIKDNEKRGAFFVCFCVDVTCCIKDEKKCQTVMREKSFLGVE